MLMIGNNSDCFFQPWADRQVIGVLESPHKAALIRAIQSGHHV
jgi:hypothetical protein